MTNTNRIYTRSFSIPADSIDENGHVNNVAYETRVRVFCIIGDLVAYTLGYTADYLLTDVKWTTVSDMTNLLFSNGYRKVV